MKNIRTLLTGVFIATIFLLLPLVGFYGEWLWFVSVGFAGVLTTIIYSQISIIVTIAILFTLIIYGNLQVVRKIVKKNFGIPVLLPILLMGLILGVFFSSGWETVLKFSNATPFGITDPIFNQDIGFYVFELPYYKYALSFITITLGFVITSTFLAYAYLKGYTKKKKPITINGGTILQDHISIDWAPEGAPKKHLYVLAGLFSIIAAVWLYFFRFDILFSGGSSFFGPGVTAISVTLPFLSLLSVVALLAGIVLVISGFMEKNFPRIMAVGIVVLIFGGLLITVAVQQLIVQPDELNKESEFIEKNIEYTLKAYGLDTVEERTFTVTEDLSKQDIDNNKGTIDNIRILDWRPLLSANNQLQVFRTYYDFRDVDIDRYNINGKYTQVMLSPRELNHNGLLPQARSWVNEHLVFTHGYGVTMSPVNSISKEGLPIFLTKDIPPKSALPLTDPEIYYGQLTNDYAIVNTATGEFDYPQGNENIYVDTYKGTGGIELSGIKRLVYAIKFGSSEILFSDSIKPESKILFDRNIEDRVNKIAPFLVYDSDPYMVISKGKLFWIYDAYTITDKYPYSQPFDRKNNYIRNSVKIVVDALNGDMKFYMAEEDPIIETYSKIFPNVFSDIDEMDEDLRAHVRYPEGLFRLQAGLYSTYHMKDPSVFYNREDIWNTPYEIYRSSRQEMTPYYIIMKLPGEEKEELVLMQPFTPRNKDNMIGWLAARSDGENYGKLTIFKFSKQELTFGPLQIEARIDQDTEISQQITLWSQSGSEVIRGNLIVIPVADTVLYVEPLYLQATESAVPELKRVIVAVGNKITMQKTLEEALSVVIGESANTGSVPKAPSTTSSGNSELIKQAQALYNQADAALRNGDLEAYARYMGQLGDVLQQLDVE
jgi:uncharacterized protein